MTNAELKAVLWREEYDFLHTNKRLGSNILFLTLSGSHAYGTNVEGSDIDIRGVAGSPEILGFNHFEQAIDNRTDTVIYAVNKFVSLLAQGLHLKKQETDERGLRSENHFQLCCGNQKAENVRQYYKDLSRSRFFLDWLF